MSDKELFEFLKKNTKLTDDEIKHDIDAGAMYYPDNEAGYNQYYADGIEAFMEDDEIDYCWSQLEVIKDISTKESYRFDWVL